MNKSIKVLFFSLVLILQVSAVSAQVKAVQPVAGKIVKWEVMGGKDNEFLIYIPQGYGTLSDGGFITGRPGIGGKVDRKLTVYRYINGVVLTMEYYEGDAKQIQKDMQDKEKSTADKSETINGFEFRQFVGNTENYFNKTQHFRIKNRLYVLKAIAKSADDPIVEGFFRSVKLIESEKVASPNVSADMTTFTLSDILEQSATKIGDDVIVKSEDADRKVIVLQTRRPKFPIEMVRNQSSGRLKLRVLYSSSGKISNVEVLESPSKQLEKMAIDAAKDTTFIPAEKDGRLVSVYKIQEYSFGTTTEIRRF
ncbi:MAG: TonB family protein [Saprospiraceae bacterium]|nr:TonB family protein [Pyrinomonadaceae bacterium]